MNLKELRVASSNDLRVYDEDSNILVNFETKLFEYKDERPSIYDNCEVTAVFILLHNRLGVRISLKGVAVNE